MCQVGHVFSDMTKITYNSIGYCGPLPVLISARLTTSLANLIKALIRVQPIYQVPVDTPRLCVVC